MPRFALLYHDCPPGYVRPSHWDLMLEVGDVLRTWALARLPRGWAAAQQQTVMMYPTCAEIAEESAVAAERLSDHRLDYLHLEGSVSGGRGEVKRIDAGTYEEVGQEGDTWKVRLDGGWVRDVVVFSDTMIALNSRLRI